MRSKQIKQYLMLLLVIGVISVAAGGNGTFASFNAQVTNPGNTFASGTLFLRNSDGTTTCNSDSNSLNVNPGTGVGGDTCATLFNVNLGTTSSATANLALTDTGTVPASDVQFRVSGCSVTNNSGVTGSSTTFGTAPTCGDFYVTIQEKTSNTYATNAFCALGPGVLATACAAPTSANTLASLSSFTNLQKDNGSGSATNATLAASGGVRFYTIRIDANPPAGNNALQNRKLTFALDWNIDS